MNIIVAAIFFWLLGRLISWMLRPWRRRRALRKKTGRVVDYRLTAERNRALALAHPMAFQAMEGGFADRPMKVLDDSHVQLLRPLTLHHFGLRTDLSESAIHEQLPQLVKTRWFSQDLDQLIPGDQPRDAMAFACARAAFFVRSAALLGWIDESLQWKILQLNAGRAKDCFSDWQDFGRAYARGRNQWVGAGRSDALGQRISEPDLNKWLKSGWHPWKKWRWIGVA
ncbi:MAG: DUF1266 domain-containing protein [Giesbergeria sp.]